MAEKMMPHGEAQPPPLQRRTSRRRIKAPIMAALGLLATVSVWRKFQHPAVLNDGTDKSPSWSWEDVNIMICSMCRAWLMLRQVKPSRSLQWTRCYDDALECARLDVRRCPRAQPLTTF